MNIVSNGKCSDIIAACAVLSDIYNKTGQRSSICCAQGSLLPESRFEFIKPLIQIQPYIQRIALSGDIRTDAKNIAGDMDLRDSFAVNNNIQSCLSCSPWISIPQEQRKIQTPYIVLAATPRYRCCTDFSYLRQYAQDFKVVFIGQPYQYDSLCRQYAQYYPVNSIMDAAQLIKHSSLFIGTQTLFTWLAQALGVDRIVAVSPVHRTLRLKTVGGFRGVFLHPAQLMLMLQSWKRYHGKQTQVGYVINTDGNPSYVQLQLEMHKSFGHKNILVSDNGSRNQKLKQLCQEYGAVLRGWDTKPADAWTAKFRNFTRGFGKSLQGCDWIVFMDQTFLWTKDFQPSIRGYDRLCWKPCIYASFGEASFHKCLAVNKTAIPEALLNGFYNGASVQYKESAVRNIMVHLAKAYGEKPYMKWTQLLESRDGIVKYDYSPEPYFTLSQQYGFPWKEEDFSLQTEKFFV